MVEVAEGEKGNPCPFIMTKTVNQERQRKVTRNCTRDCIHHPSQMDSRVKPKCTRHLLLGELSLCHTDHGFPVQFSQPLGQLPFGWCVKHLELVVKIFSDSSPQEFNVTITVEALGKGAGGSAKEADCRKNTSEVALCPLLH
jgi:hypothetical protein